MSAAAVAVSGRAGVVSSWLNLVERLGVGADEEIGCGVAPIAASQELEGRSATGPAVQGPSSAAPTLTRRNADGPRHVFPQQRTLATPPCS
jgi:hypothetical protein